VVVVLKPRQLFLAGFFISGSKIRLGKSRVGNGVFAHAVRAILQRMKLKTKDSNGK
jgi:hypothetical protein